MKKINEIIDNFKNSEVYKKDSKSIKEIVGAFEGIVIIKGTNGISKYDIYFLNENHIWTYPNGCGHNDLNQAIIYGLIMKNNRDSPDECSVSFTADIMSQMLSLILR